MEAITIRLEESTIEALDGEATDHDRTRSEHIREVVRSRNEHERIRAEYEERLSEYEDRIDELERENERLRNEKRLVLEQRDENTELRRYVEDELTYREAGLGTRMKWWLFGKGGG